MRIHPSKQVLRSVAVHHARPRAGACLASLALLAATGTSATATESRLLTITQASDFTVTARNGSPVFTDIASRIWQLPPEGGNARALTPEHDSCRRPALAPDGRTLAYQCLIGGYFQIILRVPDSEPQQITNGNAHHTAPAWTADGRRLVLATDRGGDFSIWELDIGSRTLRQLTFERGDERDPAPSPVDDGLAYIADRDGRSALVLRSAGPSPRVLFEQRSPLYAPAWRPDASVLSFVAQTSQGPRLNMAILSSPAVIKPLAPAEAAGAGPAVWLDRGRLLYTADGQLRSREFGVPRAGILPFTAALDLDLPAGTLERRLPAPVAGGSPRALAGFTLRPDGGFVVAALGALWELDPDGRPRGLLTPDSALSYEPAVSTDGRRLAYVSDRSGRAQVWLMDLQDKRARQLSQAGRAARFPAWSSDSTRLVWLEQARASDPWQLVVSTYPAGKRSVLATDLAVAASPAWSPDGSRIVLAQNEGGNAQLMVWSLDGGVSRRRLTLPREALGQGLPDVQWSPDGRSLLVASAAGLRTLPVLDDGFISAQWTSLTDEGIRQARWGRDGTTVFINDGSRLGALAPGAAVRAIPVTLEWPRETLAGRTVIRAGRLFDGQSDHYLYHQDVVMEAGRIVAVEPTTADALPEGTRLIDARDRMVMPGLIDTAVGFSSGAGTRPGIALLAWGVTTVQALTQPADDLRDMGERWSIRQTGPRLVQSPVVCTAAQAAVPNGTHAVLQGALRSCATGVREIAGIAAAARDFGVPVWSADWQGVLTGLVDGVAPPLPGRVHPAELPSARTGLLQQDAIDVLTGSAATLVSGLAAQALPLLGTDHADLLERAAPGPADRARLANNPAVEAESPRIWLRQRQRLLSRVHAGGGRIVTGSGVSDEYAGLGLHAEIRWLIDAGIAPASALRMATRDAARSLGLAQDIGSVAPGQVADLLIIDGDPLAEPSSLTRIETVVLAGVARPVEELLGLPPPMTKKLTPRSRSRRTQED